jgi:hypothetical protein
MLKNSGMCSCFTKLPYGELINALKMWQMFWNDTNKNSMHNEIERSLNSRMPASVQFRIFYLPACCLVYRTIIVPLVPYGCESWPVTLREEHTLRLFKNRILRKTFGPKREKVTGGCQKLHSGELHGLYFLQNNIFVICSKRMRWLGHMACMGGGEICVRFWLNHFEDLGLYGRIILKWIFISIVGYGLEWSG